MPTTEIRTLVPKQILERAQAFAANGLYDKALELLERNKMEFEIHGQFMKMRMPAPAMRQRQYHFSKGGK